MKRRLREIDFNEALERTRKGERVYAFDLSAERLSAKLFERLEISETVTKDYSFYIVEEVDK